MTPEEESQFKEVLYLLLEKVRATKAAVYLLETTGGFRLMAQYGFTRVDRLPDRLQRSDALANAIFERREPRYVNDVRQAGRLAEAMETASSRSILTAPVYLDGRIVGLLDARDKAGGQPFGPDDLPWVKEIVQRFALKARGLAQFAAPVVDREDESLFERTARFQPEDWARTGGLGDTASPFAAFEPAPFEEPRRKTAPHAATSLPPLEELSIGHLPTSTDRTLRLVEERLAAVASAESVAPGVSARDATLFKQVLETGLLFPDVVVAAISLFDARGAETWLASSRPLGPDVEPALFENLEKVVARAGGDAPGAEKSVHVLPPPQADGPAFARADVAAIQSSVLSAAGEEVMVLSLVFRHGPGAEARDTLKSFHQLIKNALAELKGARRYREAYRALVNKYLEPGLKRYANLKTHSFNVGRMSRKFATHLGLSTVEVEQLTVAGILHDVGMRELNYEELYAKRTLSETELKLLREHARVGALLVEEVPWPYAVAPLIRHHHERWDGSGYPDGLRAEKIPLGARAIHLCEAFDAMTSNASYRSVLSVAQALDILTSKAGTQFDPELARAFCAMVEGMRA